MKQIPLTQGLFALVDNENYDWLMQWKWKAHKGRKTWYASRCENKQTILMHRVIMAVFKKSEVDHCNGNGLDNQFHNLRVATSTQNRCNAPAHKDNISGFKGVHKTSVPGLWRVGIRFKGKSKNLGCFKDPVEAAIAYDKAALEIHGVYAKTNFTPCNAVI